MLKEGLESNIYGIAFFSVSCVFHSIYIRYMHLFYNLQEMTSKI